MERAISRPERVLHDGGARVDSHADVQDGHSHRDVKVARNSVCRVQGVLVHSQVNVVGGLYVIAYETCIVGEASRQSALVRAGL